MHITLIFIVIITVYAQTGTPVLLPNSVTLDIFPAAYLQLYSDPTSFYYPSDFYQSTDISMNNIYTLGSNQIVQIYSKLNPSTPIQNFTNYSYSFALPFTLVYASASKDDLIVALTSFKTGILKHIVYSADQNGISAQQSIVGDNSFTTSPSKVWIRDSIIYSYFRSAFSNDSVYITTIASNTSQLIILPCQACSVTVAPNKEKAIVWDRYSRLYIYSVGPSFTLLYTYNESVIASQYYTEVISISGDSQLAIVQADNYIPIKVISINSYTTQVNVSSYADIRSTAFLDSQNRFILIETLTGNYVYDIQMASIQSIPGSFPSEVLMSDSSYGFILSAGSTNSTFYGVNISDTSGILASFPPIITATNTTSNLTNSTSNLTNSSTTPSQIDIAAQFYFNLSQSEALNQTLTWIGDNMVIISDVVQKLFSIIFSSPLAIYFLSLFNYFTMSSLYILLNIRVPWVIFYYLSIFYYSCSGNIISTFDENQQIDPLSVERVDQARPLYFQISSDIASANYLSFIIIGANIVLYELLVFITGRGPQKLMKMHRTLAYLRIQIYWGLVVSNMIPIILPWKYDILGGTNDYPSKLNLSTQYLLIAILPLLLVFSFLHELSKTKRQKHRIKTALRQWWDNYQNFIYPLLVLIKNPIYFIVIIGIGDIFFFYNSFYVHKYKAFSVMKAIYPVLFHSCFIVFLTCNNSFILAVATVLCMTVFFIGSAHHLIETAVIVINFSYNFIKQNCKKSNRISAVNAPGLIKAARSKVRPAKISKGRAKLSDLKNKKEGVNLKKIMQKVQQSIKNHPIKVSYKSGDVSQNQKKLMMVMVDHKKRVRISKDRRQGSELIMNWIEQIKPNLASKQ